MVLATQKPTFPLSLQPDILDLPLFCILYMELLAQLTAKSSPVSDARMAPYEGQSSEEPDLGDFPSADSFSEAL